MRQWPERRRRQARIEIIPMIDVMMFLLVFFVLISINVLPALGLHVALPVSSAPEKIAAPKKVTISLGRDGELTLDRDAITIGDLTARLRALHAEDDRLAVIIAGDQGAMVQRLVEVLDALKAAGVPAASIIAKAP